MRVALNIEPNRLIEYLHRFVSPKAKVRADSRQIESGDIFFAYPVGHGNALRDGRQYIDAAIQNGAAVIVFDPADFESDYLDHPQCVAVENLATKAGELCAQWYGYPSQKLHMIGVTGTNGKTTTVRLISHLLSETGLRVGMTGTDGVYINHRLIDTGDCSGPKSARNVLMHPDVDAAVLETARGGLLREGLGFDRCEVAVVTNIGEGDHLGLNYITSVEDLAVLKRVIVQNVAPTGAAVLNAADPMVAKMGDKCSGRVIFFAQNQHHPVITAHRAKNKKVIFFDGTYIVASKGSRVMYRFPVSEIPLTQNGVLGFQVENAMAAIGAAWALGLDAEKIARGLHSFESTANSVPGRFNQFQHKGATVIEIGRAHV